MKVIRLVLISAMLMFSVNVMVHGQSHSVSGMYDLLQKGNDELDDQQLLALTLKLRKEFADKHYNNDSVLAKIHHLTGRSYWQLDSLVPGKKFTEEAIRINSSGSASASAENCANSYFNLIGINRALNDVPNAIKAFDNGVKTAQKYPSKSYLLPEFYQTVANLYYDIGDYQKCIDYSEIGERIAINQNLPKVQVNNLFEKIQALIALKRVDEGFKLLQKTSLIASKIKDLKTKGLIMTQVASVFKAQGEYARAIESYKKAFTDFEQHLHIKNINSDVRFNCAVVLNNIGNIYLEKLKNYPEALIYFQKSLKYVNENLARSRILGNVAQTYARMNEFDLALKTYNSAFEQVTISYSNKSQVSNLQAKTIRNVSGKLYLLTLISDKANNWLDYAKYTGNDEVKLQNALDTYMLADTMIDYMRWEHSGNVSKLFWRDKTRGMYERAIETCYLLNDDVKAFYFFEKSRAVMLNDQLNELGASQLLSANELEKERILKQKVTDLQNKLGESIDNEKEISNIRTLLFSAQEEQEKFVRNIEKTNSQYYAYKYDNRVLTLEEFRSRILAKGQNFLTYFVGDSAVYGFFISSNSVKFKKIDSKKYNISVNEFQHLIANKEAQNKAFSQYLSVSSRLYQILVKPFDIPVGSRVIISPDGSFLPFEALSKSSVDPQYLVNDYAFSYTYSAGYLAKSKRKKVSPFPFYSFMGFAPVNFNPKLSQVSLPGSDGALREIGQHFLSSVSLIGPEASRNTFREKAPDYRIVQLLTHASADSTDTVPKLYFADSTLRLTELTSPRQSAIELLVLSACQTGLGKNQRGEGVFSLARGFAAVGIPSTLTTLWSVENNAVYELTKLFYNGLRDDLPLDIALQQAQIQWLNTASKSNQLPYSWAGMVLVGNAEPIETGWLWSKYYLVPGALLIILSFFLYRRSRKFKHT